MRNEIYRALVAKKKIFSIFAALTLSAGLWAEAPANVKSVDLGLPSGLKWATFNVGATAPEDYGDYFAWGETEPYYSSQDPLTWKTGKEAGYSWQSYCGSGSFAEWSPAPYDATTNILKPEFDAATANWGSDWRMPTKEELDELKNNCTWTWTEDYNGTGIKGYIVTSKAEGNNNSIFLPASGNRSGSSLDYVGSYGCYWSSSLYEGYTSEACYLFFGALDGVNWDSFYRYFGQSVRPVTTKLIVPVAPAVPYITPVYNTEGDVTSGIARWDTLTCADYKVVENATEVVTWGVAGDTTWYVVKDTISLAMGAICVGDVRLILADSAQLTTTSSNAGIQVSGTGNSIAIYGQAEQSGQLIANGGKWAAGIGGGNGGVGSNITINGGTITAKGGDMAAGIGGGKGGCGSNITINGGTITANGKANAAGIGGGHSSSASSNIFVATNYLIKAENNNPPTTVIENDGTDLASSLAGKRYAILKTLPYDTVSVTVKDTLCYQQLFISRLQSVTPMQDTTFNDTIVKTVYKDSTFRDSIYIYELKVWPAMTTTEQTDSLCATYGSFTWSLGSRDSIITDFVIGENHREYMYQNILGCDSAKFVLDVAVWPAMTTTEQTDSLCATYVSFTWSLGSRDSIITDFVVGDNHREYMYQNILGCDSAKFILDVAVWPAMTTTEQTDSLCATYGSFTWSLGSRDSIITDFVIGDNHREYMYQNILGCDSAKFILDVAVWPAAKDEPTKYDTILVDNLPYIWSTYTGMTLDCYTEGTYRDTAYNILGCDSIRYTLELAIIAHDTVTKEIELDLCHGESYTSRKQTVTPYLVGDTTFSDIVPSIMMEPLLMRDSVYAYTIHVQSRYVDELPALVKLDSWLLVVDRKGIEDKGISFTADQVQWYRVEGEVDEYPFGENNDTHIGTGDYYTIAEKMSGQYYALIDVDVSWLAPCATIARTVILDCDAPSGSGPKLTPTIVQAGGLMTLSNLSEGESNITVYSASGQLIRTEKVINQTEHEMHAEGVTGVYLLQVTNKERNDVFKYIITH